MSEQGMNKWIITVTVILSSMLEVIDTSIVNVALNDMMGNLGATINEVSWVVSAYAIANVIVVPMAGWLAGQFGRRNYYAGSIVLFTISSFFCGNSGNIWELVLWRFLQGMGGGALLATSQSILVETFPPEELGLANGLFGMGVVIGPTIGPTVGGWIVDNFSWPWIFYVNIPLGIMATMLTLTYIRNSTHGFETKQSWGGVDWYGMMLLILGIGSLQLVLEEGQREDWFDSTFILLFTLLAIVGIIAFIWRELTTKKPIVDLRVLRHPPLAFGTSLTFVLGFGLYTSVFVFPIFAQRILGFTATQTGLILFPGALTTGFMMPWIGKMIQRGVPQKWMISMGFFLFSVFTWMMYSVISPVSGEGDFFWPLIVRGVGMSLLFVPLTTLALSGLKGREIAQGAGLTNMMRQLGGSFGVAIVSTYIERKTYENRMDLLQHLSVYDFELRQRLGQIMQGFMAKGSPFSVAQQQAYRALEGMLTRQAMLITYRDIFLVLGIFFLACIPFVMLIKVKKSARGAAPASLH